MVADDRKLIVTFSCLNGNFVAKSFRIGIILVEMLNNASALPLIKAAMR
jgi:hypothetical protein